MPAKSNMVVYGNFSKQKASYTQEDFHKKDKHIEAFLILFNWLTSLTQDERTKWFKLVADDLQNHAGKIFGSSIIKEVDLENWQAAIGESEKDASTGKYLIKCI